LNTPALDLELRNVTKRYGGHTAVDDLSFTVPHGSFFSILGPSGCGKTTLLRMIAGFISPDSGTVYIGGRNMKDIAPNRRPVNMVFQQLALFPMMSVGENVAYGLARRGVARTEQKKKVADMLTRVGLAGSQDKPVDALSGGQRQRVAIARSLVLEPTLLLLDEPLGALDLKLREHMKLELKQLQAAFGTTFVYITHDQSEALVLSDRVAVMNQGRFEQVGSPQQLYYAAETPFVASFVGANNRIEGVLTAVASGIGDIATSTGVSFCAKLSASLSVGSKAQIFIRPESISLYRQEPTVVERVPCYQGTVTSLLFDGANSSVLLKEETSDLEFRVALPQTGYLSDLKTGEKVHFSFDPERALCYPAEPSARV